MKMKNRKKNLKARLAAFESMRETGTKGTGKWVMTGSGKNVFFNRPGSLKK